MSLYASRDFSAAAEIEGSGVRQFSEFNTTDFLVARAYVQKATAYKPLPLSTPDSVYKTAYLVEESEERRELGHVWFRRVYATLPTTRTERQEVQFTFPGRSGIVKSTVNGKRVGRWDRYGLARPATVAREALVQFSYSLGEPVTGFTTLITYDGQVVDFTGSVYSEDGEDYLGSTSPRSAPFTFIISDVARRWRGNIWERQQVTVDRFGFSALGV